MKCTQCDYDFDSLYTFCPHCGKEREQVVVHQNVVSEVSMIVSVQPNPERERRYAENLAFLRDQCASPKMLLLIFLIAIPSFFLLVQLIDQFQNYGEKSSGLGLWRVPYFFPSSS
ncbi:MAG: hypothetical protein MZU97_25445 [Bacillus subtilis]|nr:hypothetical protein [Bacillus subtilis]